MTSEKRFYREVWYVLDKIKYQLLINKPSRVITYTTFYNPQAEVNQFAEQEIFILLQNEGVIKKAKGLTGTFDPDKFSIGKQGEKDSQIGLIFHFEATNKFEDYYEKYKKYGGLSFQDTKETLILYRDGNVSFTTVSGNVKKGKFRIKSNPYNLLLYMSKEPYKIFSFDELVVFLKKPRSESDSTNERRVRDTIQSIRKELKLAEGELFIVDYGFGLNCDVQIRK